MPLKFTSTTLWDCLTKYRETAGISAETKKAFKPVICLRIHLETPCVCQATGPGISQMPLCEIQFSGALQWNEFIGAATKRTKQHKYPTNTFHLRKPGCWHSQAPNPSAHVAPLTGLRANPGRHCAPRNHGRCLPGSGGSRPGCALRDRRPRQVARSAPASPGAAGAAAAARGGPGACALPAPGPSPPGTPAGGDERDGGVPGVPAAPPPAPSPRMRGAPSPPPGRAAGEGERLSAHPFSSWPPVSAVGAAGSSRPASSCCRHHRGARRPPGSTRSEGEERVSDTRRPPGSADERSPPCYLRAPPPPAAGAGAPRPRCPAITPRLHGQDNMAPAGSPPEVKGVTVLTLAWHTRAPASAIFAEGNASCSPRRGRSASARRRHVCCGQPRRWDREAGTAPGRERREPSGMNRAGFTFPPALVSGGPWEAH